MVTIADYWTLNGWRAFGAQTHISRMQNKSLSRQWPFQTIIYGSTETKKSFMLSSKWLAMSNSISVTVIWFL